MARSRGSRLGFPQRTARRRSGWAFGPGGTTQQTSTTGSSVILGAYVTPTVDGLTVVRIRGDLMLYLSATTGAVDGFLGAVGIGLSTEAALDVGVGSVPTPITEEDWDGWLYHRYFSVRGPGAAVPTIGIDMTSTFREAVDTKAMRKLNEESGLYFAVEMVLTGTATLRMQFNSRMLLKLA